MIDLRLIAILAAGMLVSCASTQSLELIKIC